MKKKFFRTGKICRNSQVIGIDRYRFRQVSLYKYIRQIALMSCIKYINQIPGQYLKGRLRKVQKTEWKDTKLTDERTDGQTDRVTDGEETYSPPGFTSRGLKSIKASIIMTVHFNVHEIYIYTIYK